MAIQGKGFFIWKIPDCERGDANAIAFLAQQANLNYVCIKVADRVYSYNYDQKNHKDLVPAVANALRSRGIQVYGWHHIVGDDPVAEARIAIQRIQELNLDGMMINALQEFQGSGKSAVAKVYMSELRRSLPDTTLALNSFRFPSLHTNFPWQTFLDQCNYSAPLVYWENAHNPAAQLRRCVREMQALSVQRPVIPTGATYSTGSWKSTPGEIIEFLDACRALELPSASFYCWDSARKSMDSVWSTIASYSWTGGPPIPFSDSPVQFIAALNHRDPYLITNLYATDAVLVTSSRTLQGWDSIRSWYANLFSSTLPNAVFRLLGYTGTGNTRYFTWTADSSVGVIRNGMDTFGLEAGRIKYHYMNFSISPI